VAEKSGAGLPISAASELAANARVLNKTNALFIDLESLIV
jgi:hypothetical protein